MHHVPPHPHRNPQNGPSTRWVVGTLDRSVEKKTGPNFFVTETQWPWLGGISWWVTWILAGFLSLLQKRLSSAHGIWNSFVVESHQWNSTFALQVADWWCVWKGFRWGGEVGCVFGFTWSWTTMTNKLALRSQICNCTGICWFDTLKILKDYILYTLCSCCKKLHAVTTGGSPNSAHQSDRSSNSRYLRWLTKKEVPMFFPENCCISCFETTYFWWKNSITIGKLIAILISRYWDKQLILL